MFGDEALLRPEYELSQFGTKQRQFKNVPDPGQTELSLAWGRLDAGAMTYLTCDGQTSHRPGRQLVRHTTVGRIRAASPRFGVRHDPTDENPLHVSVGADGDWDADLGKLFERCFDEESSDVES
ncbi:MAG: hypothetical protein WCF24_11430 [Acidimicrobiales bacterium]